MHTSYQPLLVFSYFTLCKTLQFHQVFWRGNFAERQSFRSLEGCTFLQYFNTRQLIEITVFYALNKSALAWKLLLKGIPAYSSFYRKEKKNLKKGSPLFTSWNVRLFDYEYMILISVLIEIILRGLKGTLSRLRQFLIIESVLIMMKNAFISF